MNRTKLARSLAWLFFGFLLAGLPGPASGEGITLLDGLRYESDFASRAVAPEPILQIPYGPGEQEIPGAEQETGEERVTSGGTPSAFRPLPDGSTWILDAITPGLKQFSRDGQMRTRLSLAAPHAQGPVPIRDFVPLPGGGFALLCLAHGEIEWIDGQGKLLHHQEGFQAGDSLGVDARGNVWVSIPEDGELVCFDRSGSLTAQVTGLPGLTPWTDAQGRPYGLTGDDAQAVLWRVEPGSPPVVITLATLTPDLPPTASATLAGQTILGTDAEGNLYLELVALDGDGVVHLDQVRRYSPAGEPLGRLDVRPLPFPAWNLARRMMVTPAGRVVTCHSGGGRFQVMMFPEIPR